MPASQQSEPHVLRHIGVLVFVNQNIFEPALILLKYIRVVLKNRDHQQKQIAKIDSIQIAQPALILGINFSAKIVISTGFCAWYFFRRPSAVFPIVNNPGKLPRWPAFFINICSGNQLF